MRFNAEHRLHGTRQAIVEVLCDPEFYLALELPDLSLPELIDRLGDDTSSSVKLRYEFVGQLDPMARRLLGQHRLAWIQEVRVDRSSFSGSISFGAELDPRRLHGEASFNLVDADADEPAGADETVRRLEGELVVAVPGIGLMAERRIVPGVVRRLDIEAEAINKRLESPE